MRVFRVFGILVVITLVSTVVSNQFADAAIVGGANSTQYTCEKKPGETPTCTCTGGLDCIMMCKSKVCEGGCDVLSCTPDGNSCTCDWKQSVRPTNWKRQMLVPQAPMKVSPAR